MQIKKIMTGLVLTFCSSSFLVYGEEIATKLCTPQKNITAPSLSRQRVADLLGWVQTPENRCGGYYLEKPFILSQDPQHPEQVKISIKEGVFSLKGTSKYTGGVTIAQNDQQIFTDNAFVYRNLQTYQLKGIDVEGHVVFREPNNLILASCGYLDLQTDHKILQNILYRTAIYSQNSTKPGPIPIQELSELHKVYQLSAWGWASRFQQKAAKVYEFTGASYTTCPPLLNSWQIKADSIVLDKEAGRGTARHAKLLVRDIPILYAPYFNFPLDARRQSGFLFPTAGSSSVGGINIATPFYWNIAPNYDDTITPNLMFRRGLQLNNTFRYLKASPAMQGDIEITLLPHDKLFADFQKNTTQEYANTTNPVTQSELNRLENASTTRGAIALHNETKLNNFWFANLDYNLVSDDYYLKDFSNNLNEITPNQLLQEGNIYYKGPYINFTGRIQAYQTLHPIEENNFYNQYVRLPQLILDANYYDEKTRLNYTINNEFTYFNIAKNPGNLNLSGLDTQPVGERIHTQPGINFPYYRPAFYIDPRLQFAFTQYEVQQVAEGNSNHPKRALPIVDVHGGLFFDRSLHLFKHKLHQTLEPQFYYTYVPYRNQDDIPIFDTTLNTLTYDQLFRYNRFNGIDRIGDANQLSIGLATRLLDEKTGYQKATLGVGQIIYFANRRVTLCEAGTQCNDYPNSAENTNRQSPLSGIFSFNMSQNWTILANTIWNTQTNQLDNQTMSLQYYHNPQRLVTLNYTYVRNADPQLSQEPANNLSQTDLSFTWPLSRDWSTVGRWTEDWNHTRFHNLLYGLQYNTCCWSVRIVAGRTFNSLTNGHYDYNTEFYIQFALKGLGSFGSGNPGKSLNNYAIVNETNFGQDF